MIEAKYIKQELARVARPEKVADYQRFFKTGSGQYGEGDVFIGVSAPLNRKIAKLHTSADASTLKALLHSPIHEHRICALYIMTYQAERAEEVGLRELYKIYLSQTKYINNWDLVDVSAPKIIGRFLYTQKDRFTLYDLAHSLNLWERRIAIISTSYFISKGQFTDTLNISDILLKDTHDLIHKAVGWMLREVGKQDQSREVDFLKKRYTDMPRTMLRYAIEKYPEEIRQRYLRGEV